MKWISTKDQLPEFNKQVLIIAKPFWEKNGIIFDVAYLEEEDNWKTGDDYYDIQYMKKDVSYWMPLPVPPEDTD